MKKIIIVLVFVVMSACTHIESTSIGGTEYLTVDAWCLSMWYWRWLPNHDINYVRATGEDHARKHNKRIDKAEFDTKFDMVCYGIMGYTSAKGAFVLRDK